MNTGLQLRFISIIIAFLWMTVTAFGQEPALKQFLSVRTVGIQLLTKPVAGSESVSNYSKRLAGLDTLEILEEKKDFYRVRYFSTVPSLEEGWLKKGRGQKKFNVEHLYSLAQRYLLPESLPSKEKRMQAALDHPEWNAVVRFSFADGYVVSGMTPGIVVSCFGKADERIRYFTSLIKADQWTYYFAPEKDLRLTFENNRLVIFEDPLLLSSKSAEIKIFKEKQGFFYPHRLTSMKIMLGGVIAMIAGYSGLHHQKILSKASVTEGESRIVSKSNTADWLLIGVGFAAEALGGFLFNYTPDIKIFMIQTNLNPDKILMIGVNIPLTFHRQ